MTKHFYEGFPDAIAYCDAGGVIGFVVKGEQRLPQGVLPIISGPEPKVRHIIAGTCRHAYDNKTMLVPGVPEASDQTTGLEALQRYIKWIRPRLSDPFYFDSDGNEIDLGDIVFCDYADEFGILDQLECEIVYLCKNGKVKLKGEGRLKTLHFYTAPALTTLHQRALS